MKQEASNSVMAGFCSRPTANRSSTVWYSSPSAPSTCTVKSMHDLTKNSNAVRETSRRLQSLLAVVGGGDS